MASIQKRVVRNVLSLEESTSCAEAARVMAQHGIGSVGVLRDSKLVGLVTDRDLVAAVAMGRPSEATPIGEAMRADLPAVSANASDRECAQLMRNRHTRHLLVKEGDAIVGIISMLDLVDLVVGEKQGQVEELESYIRGGRALGLSQPTRTIFEHEVLSA
ncbi:MAG TPA: CBS domain-containing protein [Anaeromyxobacteraceae bacterium]|nr:CBS domain-containing protein [Anaeromyxobacteraceae bacterium]